MPCLSYFIIQGVSFIPIPNTVALPLSKQASAGTHRSSCSDREDNEGDSLYFTYFPALSSFLKFLILLLSSDYIHYHYYSYSVLLFSSSCLFITLQFQFLRCNILAPTNIIYSHAFNPLAPNDVYISRTAQLTSRRCIFKHLLNKYTY